MSEEKTVEFDDGSTCSSLHTDRLSVGGIRGQQYTVGRFGVTAMSEYKCNECQHIKHVDKGGNIESVYCPFCNDHTPHEQQS